jgi:hypothetical protein
VVVASHELVVFAEYTHLSAYGTAGLAWESDRLVWDDLHVLRIEGDTLIAEGFDAPRNGMAKFAVDLATGASADAPFAG